MTSQSHLSLVSINMENQGSQTASEIKPDDVQPSGRADTEQEPSNSIEIPDGSEDDVEDACSICLHCMEDRTVIPKCSHEFCFECLLVWAGQSRRCPLCNQELGDYLIHGIRSRYDYRKHFLPPLKSSSPTVQREDQEALRNARQRAARQRRERRRNNPHDHLDEADRLERSIAQRRWVYQHDLYAKHVGSNSYTKYRPYPIPSQFAASPDLMSRTTTFLRRELRVWEGLDVEFLTNLIISLMKSIDIRSESAVKLLSEFLDLDALYVVGGKHVNAEHFAHEVYCYIRSPYKDLFVYDTIVQYDSLPEIQPSSGITRRRRWNQRGDLRSLSPPADSPESSRGGVSGRRQSGAGHHRNESPPRSRRRLISSVVKVDEMGQVASTSRCTPKGPIRPSRIDQASDMSSSSSQSPLTTPSLATLTADVSMQEFLENIEPEIFPSPEVHVNTTTQDPLDRKGKGRVARNILPPLLPNPSHDKKLGEYGHISSTRNWDRSNGTQAGIIPSRQPIRKDLKSSIRSYLS